MGSNEGEARETGLPTLPPPAWKAVGDPPRWALIPLTAGMQHVEDIVEDLIERNLADIPAFCRGKIR